MKKLLFYITGVLMLASCSDEFKGMDIYKPEKEPVAYDGAYAVRCANGDRNVQYDCVGSKHYTMDSETKGKWIWLGIEDGGRMMSPEYIVFDGGKVYTPMARLPIAMGGNFFRTALGMYCSKIHRWLSVFILRDFDIDYGRGTMNFGTYDFDFVGFTDDKLTLTFEFSFEGGRTHKGGKKLEVSRYELASDIDFHSDDVLKFDNVEDAYVWLIDAFIDTFGESGNMNTNPGTVIYDNPEFKIEYLIEELERYRRGELPL